MKNLVCGENFMAWWKTFIKVKLLFYGKIQKKMISEIGG